MKKFLLNSIYFLGGYVIIAVAIRFFLPYYWGNPWVGAKFKYEQKQIEKSNILFIGSSRVYRQIIPELFDSITHQQSYNLGAPATYTPQTYYLLENYLQENHNLSYCFIELMDVGEITRNLFHQERTNYYLTPKYWFFSSTVMFQKGKTKQWQRYTTSFIENILHFGHFKEQLLNNQYYHPLYVGKKGFLDLNRELSVTNDTVVIRSLQQRQQILKTDSTILLKRAKTIINFQNQTLTPGHKHLSEINNIIKTLTQQGIHPYFMLLPRYSSKEAYAIAGYIPEKYLIDLTNPKKYPEFYQVKYSFDEGHLNSLGAQLLTRRLAYEFLSKQTLK